MLPINKKRDGRKCERYKDRILEDGIKQSKQKNLRGNHRFADIYFFANDWVIFVGNACDLVSSLQIGEQNSAGELKNKDM